MFAVFCQDRDNKSSHGGGECIARYTGDNNTANEIKALDMAARKYIAEKQGTDRSLEPIKSMVEIEDSKYKLDDGLYLVNDGTSAILVCRISSIETPGWIFGSVRTKKVEVCKYIYVSNLSSVPIVSLLGAELPLKSKVASGESKVASSESKVGSSEYKVTSSESTEKTSMSQISPQAAIAMAETMASLKIFLKERREKLEPQ